MFKRIDLQLGFRTDPQMGAGLQLAQDIFKSGDTNSDPTLRLRKLKKLLDEQLITNEEYEQKKNEILSKL